MGKKCAVDDCDSGSYKNLALRRAAGLAPIALFSIPKRNNALILWSNALRQKLLNTDFICELHFAKDDVIKVDKTVLYDGTVHSIPRQKPKLVANATPIAITEKMPIDAENTAPETLGLAVQQRDPLEMQQQIEHVALQVPPQQKHDSLQWQNRDHTYIRENYENMQMNRCEHMAQLQSINNLPLNLPPTPKVSYPTTHESPNTQSLRSKTDMPNADFSGLDVPCGSFVNNQSSIVSPSYCQQYQTNKQSPPMLSYSGCKSESNGTVIHELPNVVPTDNGTTEVISESPMDIQESIEFNVPTDADTNADENGSWTADVCLPFTIDKVFDCLRAVTLLPQRWCWMENRRDERSIVFLQFDTYTQAPSVRVVLYNDLSVMVQTADEKVSMELDVTITSVDSLEKLLKNISKQVICCGTGMDEESRDESCLGIVPLNKYKRHVTIPRCHFCQKVRVRIQCRKNKRQTNLKVLYARSKHKATVKHRECKRLRNKVKRLEQRIAEAHEKCAAVKKEALQEAISALDPAQQEAVTAWFGINRKHVVQQQPQQDHHQISHQVRKTGTMKSEIEEEEDFEDD